MSKATYSEAKIRDGTGRLVRGTVDGKPAWSNGHIMEIGTDTPFKKLKSVHWSENKPNFQEIVDGLKKRAEFVTTGEKLLPKGICHPPYTELTAGNARQVIDENYHNFFKIRYPDCQFRITKGFAPVAVYNGEMLVGLIMPIVWMRMEDQL